MVKTRMIKVKRIENDEMIIAITIIKIIITVIMTIMITITIMRIKIGNFIKI